MIIRSFWLALLLALNSLLAAPLALAQAIAPVIRTFTVDQVTQLTPGTELIFRVNGTAGGALGMRIDGSDNQIGLTETRAGVYEGAYTISSRDKIRHDSKVDATLRIGERQATMTLAQTLLKPDAHAKAVAATGPQISRFETRKTTGAWTGGNEISFTLAGTPGGKASVTMDGGKTVIPLDEEKSGLYSGEYTIKNRDKISDTTTAVATLMLGTRKTTMDKAMAVAAATPKAIVTTTTPATTSTSASTTTAAAAKCNTCGVVTEINSVTTKGKPNYVGAIAGGVAGAALGSQVGKGDGNTVATVAGAVGGALAGREIEKRVRSTKHFEVIVKMQDGTMRTAAFEAEPPFKVGSKVRFNGDTLVYNE